MQISTDVTTELERVTISTDGTRLALSRQIDRKLYLEINKVLEALGGKWHRGDQAHRFPDDVRPRLELALETGAVTTAADLGFFPTPRPLAQQLVKMADVYRKHFVLEPSAGDGNIVSAILDVAFNSIAVVAIERDAARRQILRDSFNHAPFLHVDDADDFMDYAPDEPFDRVVMNPPFARVGKGDHLDHVRHAYGMLAPGGVLVSVLPAGVQFREDKRHREFRAWLEGRGIIESLPDNSFKASGTSVRTCVLRIERP